MIIVSARELRSNMSKYADLALAGKSVVLKLPSRKSLKLVPVDEDDALMTEEEFISMVEEGRKQIADGESLKKMQGENMRDFVKRAAESL